MVNEQMAVNAINTGSCKYHCSSIPATNGISNRMVGAVFQIGMSKGFDKTSS